jgi:hypothetical protein
VLPFFLRYSPEASYFIPFNNLKIQTGCPAKCKMMLRNKGTVQAMIPILPLLH